MNKNRSQRILGISIISVFLVLLAFPILMVFFKAFQNFDGQFVGFQNFIDYLPTRGFIVSLKNSIFVSLMATVITLGLAFLYAYGVNRSNIKCKGIFHWIALLPLFAPTMTHGISLIYLFGAQGIFTKLFSYDFNIYGKWGIIISECIYIFPVIYLMFSLGLKKADNRLYEAAEILGTSKRRQLFTITLPAMKFSIITAFFSAFTMAFTDFGAPKIIGGNYSVLATEIYKKMLGQQELEMGAVVGVILIIPAVIAFIVDYIITKRNKATIDARATELVITESKKRDRSFYTINSIVASVIIILFTTIFASAFIENWPYELNLTLKWFRFDVMGMSGLEIFGNSIFVAFSTAFLGTIFAFVAAYISMRGKGFKSLNKGIYFFGILPNAIPGLTIGIAYIFFFNSASNPLNFIYGTFIILIFANIIHFFSTPFLTISNDLRNINSEYESASEIMGVSWFEAVKRVIIPMSLPSIVESFSYYFVNSMMTVSAVVFLYLPVTRIATISMINNADLGETAAAAAVAVMIIVTNIVFRVIFDRLSIRLRKKYSK
ncbi:MAG: putative 2-aminoethylphosphonate ABC transporter permease subunit [Clostridium sp.]